MGYRDARIDQRLEEVGLWVERHSDPVWPDPDF
jgi:hypothetical protein